MNNLAMLAAVLITSCSLSHAQTLNNMTLKNQYGETSINQIVSVSSAGGAIIGAAIPVANVTGKVLTGFSAAPGVVAATDTILQGFNKLAGNQPVAVSCTAGAGGAATEALTCTGLAATDTILAVFQVTPGANSLPLLGYSTLGSNTITGIWSADPGAGAVVRVTVKKN